MTQPPQSPTWTNAKHKRLSRGGLWLLLFALTSCGSEPRTPPPSRMFGDLPIGGSLADARRAGFSPCVAGTTAMRCRREKVSFEGQGPFSAAVDLDGGDGAGGFDHLTLWHPTDQSALIAVVDKLRRAGWSECLTPLGDRWADQAVYQRAGSPIFVSLDRSYWSTRRLSVYPAVGASIPQCGKAKPE